MDYISQQAYFKGNKKQFLRLTTTVNPPRLVLGIRKDVLERAGFPAFPSDLRANGYEVTDKKNMRFIHCIHLFLFNYPFIKVPT